MIEPTRLAILVQGIVQGVGFRPFVHRLATARGLAGWVHNGPEGVRIEVQGPPPSLEGFLADLGSQAPPQAAIERIVTAPAPVQPGGGFRIRPSTGSGVARPAVPPDLATCRDCLDEIADPAERRHRYPFTNCTQCGPRYTIVSSLPYDRPFTAMAGFAMCPACGAEYGEPSDRRFHAQPIACPRCGPQVRLLGPDGHLEATGDASLDLAVRALRGGEVLGLKGLGGYQLLVDAADPSAVLRLRLRKRRPEKPFAVMFPSLEALHALLAPSADEVKVLTSAAAPIVLVRQARGAERTTAAICGEVAPGNPWIGALLPNTPLHWLLLRGFGRPLVCTSGNLTDEPLCTDDADALARLGGIVDRLLAHDRPILRPMDDSVARVEAGVPRLLRRARGYAPLPLRTPKSGPTVLALGGQQKATVALRLVDQVVVSQHLGDLASAQGVALLETTARELLALFDARPEAIACDEHPDYVSTRLAESLARSWRVPLIAVQHHHAHVAAVMAEHGLAGDLLGLAWDGTGFGPDGTIWGGEALTTDGGVYCRVAHLRPFALPGGALATRDPRRAALGLLVALGDEEVPTPAAAWFAPGELAVMLQALRRGVNAPHTSSMGRLFDAVAAIAGVRTMPGFEGQAAMAMEFAAERAVAALAPGEAGCRDDEPAYPLTLGAGEPAIADWAPLVRALIADRARGVPPEVMSLRFHLALAGWGVEIAQRAGRPRVVLAGGCFQNALLSRLLRERLIAARFEVFEAERYPPNDGGLSLGQAHVAACRLTSDRLRGTSASEDSPCA